MFLYYLIFPSMFIYSFYVIDRLFGFRSSWLSWMPQFLGYSQRFATILIGKSVEISYNIIYYLYALRIKLETLLSTPKPKEQIGNSSVITKNYRIVANNIGIEGILEYIKDGKHFVAPIKKMNEIEGLITALNDMETKKEEVVMVEFTFSDNSNFIVENTQHFNKLIGQDGEFKKNLVENHFDYIEFIVKLYNVIPEDKKIERVEIMMGDGDIKTFSRKP